jgi:hypothetical protein
VLTLLAQFTWHFRGGQEMVVCDQSREPVGSGTGARRQTRGMGAKHQIAGAKSVPAQVDQ